MPTRLCDAIALLTLLAGIAAVSTWLPGDHGFADTPALSHSITDTFPTAEAGFARQRTAAGGG